MMQAEEKGFLGGDLPRTDFSFSIKVRAVPEVFLNGEETTVLTTLEGGRPMPRVRPRIRQSMACTACRRSSRCRDPVDRALDHQ